MKCRLPSITIVIPSMNQAQFLSRAISSLLCQDYSNLQIIVVDGGSTDGSVDIIQSFSSEIDQILIEQDSGQAEALIKGFRLSQGEIMGWLCSDDELLGDTLATIAALYQPSRSQWWTGDSLRYLAGETQECFTASTDYNKNSVSFYDLVYGGRIISQVATFWTKPIWIASGRKLANLHYAFDFELWCRFAKITKASCVHKPLGRITAHESSKTSSPSGWSKYIHERDMIRASYLYDIPKPLSSALVNLWTRRLLVDAGDIKALIGNRGISNPALGLKGKPSIDYLSSEN